jgi:hypothetical protein
MADGSLPTGMYNPDAIYPFHKDLADVDFRHEVD